jgi:hypothetical protein
MAPSVPEILRAFEKLSEPEKKDLAAEILRRSAHLEWPPLSEEELILNAEEVFLQLDKAESADE